MVVSLSEILIRNLLVMNSPSPPHSNEQTLARGLPYSQSVIVCRSSSMYVCLRECEYVKDAHLPQRSTAP